MSHSRCFGKFTGTRIDDTIKAVLYIIARAQLQLSVVGPLCLVDGWPLDVSTDRDRGCVSNRAWWLSEV